MVAFLAAFFTNYESLHALLQEYLADVLVDGILLCFVTMFLIPMLTKLAAVLLFGHVGAHERLWDAGAVSIRDRHVSQFLTLF